VNSKPYAERINVAKGNTAALAGPSGRIRRARTFNIRRQNWLLIGEVLRLR